MRRVLPIVAIALITAVVVSSTSLIGGAAGGGGSFTVVSRPQQSELVDVGASCDSPCDYFIEKAALWNEAETDRVGSDVVKCTLDFGTMALCTAALRFAGRGQLTGTGLVDFTSKSFSVPITGGTGDFRHVTGQVRVTPIKDGEILEFHLSNLA